MLRRVHGDLIGRVIDRRYRLIARLGAGDMAEVFLARHVLIERLSAVKVFREPIEARVRDRFLREARAANRVNHPNVVEILDYGEEDGLVYLVQEYVPGESLAKLLEAELGQGIGWARAASIGLALASALGRAHQMKVVHRDLKPSNVIVMPRREGGDTVKLTDFGMAKLLDVAATTSTGPSLASSPYAAPEVAVLGSFDARSDLFSLGVVIYEAITGTLPFARPWGTTATPLSVALPAPLVTEHVPEVPAFVAEVIATLLAPEPDDRPRDGFEAHDLLARALEGSPPARAARSVAPIAWEPGSTGAPPRLTTVPYDRICGICERALAALDRHARGVVPSPGAIERVEHARKVVGLVRGLSALVSEDRASLEDFVASSHALRDQLGARFDAVAREQSRALGWAGTLSERSYEVRERRSLGADPVPLLEAMVWEQAALENEEDLLRDRARELSLRMRDLEAELGELGERTQQESLVLTARLEGRVAALRSLALEAWQALDLAAHAIGLDLGAAGATSDQAGM
jgi:tRNA A-37 threonylcarbamoyl transferase component Bud32